MRDECKVYNGMDGDDALVDVRVATERVLIWSVNTEKCVLHHTAECHMLVYTHTHTSIGRALELPI